MFQRISQNSQESSYSQSFFFNKVASANLLKKRLWHRCFSVNFAKFSRIPFLQNSSGQQLLDIQIYGWNVELTQISSKPNFLLVHDLIRNVILTKTLLFNPFHAPDLCLYPLPEPSHPSPPSKKRQITWGFLTFSGGIERDQWH